MSRTKIPFYVHTLTVKEGILWLQTKIRVKYELYVDYKFTTNQEICMPNITASVSLDPDDKHISLAPSNHLNIPSHPTKDDIDFVVYDETHVIIMRAYGLDCRFSKDILECPWIDQSWCDVDKSEMEVPRTYNRRTNLLKPCVSDCWRAIISLVLAVLGMILVFAILLRNGHRSMV